jgi:hypothetical protein
MTQTRLNELLRVAAPLLDNVQLTPLERLALLVQLRDEVDQHITREVVDARRHHTTWAFLAKALGMKLSAAQKRYGSSAAVASAGQVRP